QTYLQIEFHAENPQSSLPSRKASRWTTFTPPAADLSRRYRGRLFHRRSQAARNYKQWFESASRFLAGSKFMISQGWGNQAAFMLHQATEHAYHATLLTLTLYTPKSHNIEFLRNRSEDLVRDLIPVWPRDSKFTRRCFELLKQAYVKARYSQYYTVRDAELEWIVERVELLHVLVKESCEAHLQKPVRAS
ncbi:HEPN domain-containing protein, partial [Novosphingobium sp. YAF33]|uniref:HEPN domain-containing protein n=1 Tax=Novosphingobium sp. YAF33 TaxID=3233082 RepID=UPI003F97C407